MNKSNLEALFQEVARGELSPQEAANRAEKASLANLGDAQVDLERQQRRGRAEAIYCQGKTTDQVLRIARAMSDAGQNVIMTRMEPEQIIAVREQFDEQHLRVEERARLAVLTMKEAPKKSGKVGVVCAGTTDLGVAEEAAITAETLGSMIERIYDVGVAGIHRLFRHYDEMREMRVLVVVAGMEGALPSVVSGLVRGPVIAVPTSVGYGASFGGVAALLGMLNSCSPGISVVNIDNGFGAGYLADVINEIGEKEDAS